VSAFTSVLPPLLLSSNLREGDVNPKQKAGPVAFILRSAPHPIYSRKGVDLVASIKLPLHQALTGGTVALETLDGRCVARSHLVGSRVGVQGRALGSPLLLAASDGNVWCAGNLHAVDQNVGRHNIALSHPSSWRALAC